MDHSREGIRDEGDFQKLHQLLSNYKDCEISLIFNYIKDDLIYIVESLNTQSLLSELKSCNIPNVEKYQSMRKNCGTSIFAQNLVADILAAGREAFTGFLEGLYVLGRCHRHPNLVAVMNEIINTGETLVNSILLDEHGHSLIPDLKKIQKHHKQYLLKKTQTLVENKPPASTLEQKHFYISERYVNLVVVCTQYFRQRSQDEITQAGEKLDSCLQKTKRCLQNIVPKRLFHWCHQLKCVPRIVMVSGVPGVGKSTLLQKFTNEWVNGNLYQRFSFVFFFKFRELNRLIKESSLEDMILNQYPYLQSQIENILQHPEKLLFIFDGLDESTHQLNFITSKLCTDTKQKERVNIIVVNLLQQLLLTGCSVLMTSRPTRLSLLPTDIFQRMVEIMGFFPKERQMYFEHFYSDKNLSERAFRFVKENDTLYTFCYIPSYCWIICTVLSMCFKVTPTNNVQLPTLPKTVTQLFVIYVANILKNHSQNLENAREVLKSLGRMAEYGILNRILVFDKHDMASFDEKICSSCLLSSFMTESDSASNVTFSFLHLIMQEFFAALINYIQFSPDSLAKSLSEAQSYQDGRGIVFLKFICGLSDKSTRSLLTPYLGELSTEASKHVIQWLKSILADEKLQGNIRDNRKLMNIFFYLFETRNNELVSASLKSFKTLDFFRIHLMPLSCDVLAFIIRCCNEIEKLHLNECYIRSEGLNRLKPAIHNIKDLSLFTNDLKDSAMTTICSALADPLCKIQKLNLSDNGLTSSSCIELANGIKNNQSLKVLDLSCNCLAGPEFNNLIDVMADPCCKIEELSLRGNGLTSISCAQVAFMVTRNQSIKKLDLSYNNLEGPEFTEFIAALSCPKCRIEELLLRYIKLTEHWFTQLASGISKNKSLRKLDLSENNVAGPHFSHLMETLSNPSCRIEELKLCGIILTDDQVPLMVQLKNNKNLKQLEMSNNTISDRSACYIRQLILQSSSLQEVILDIKGFSKETKEILMRELQNLHNDVKIDIL
ncbi:NACHT, LRR and PYD domains-containing protein 12-like [Hyperolius riggenbachi]|uniref:NACHT, LRR and PYD domains-containing protein 12-like n=1 Tax=Hyperolius riggenbachi TaxID=752182 RepID=UPI0035A3AF44